MRLFVAVAPLLTQRREIALCIEQFRGEPSGRMVPSENLHLTLAFLGEVAEDRLVELEGSLDRLGSLSPFTVEWSGLEAFPSLSRARVAVLGVHQGEAELGELAQTLSHALPDDLRPPPKKAFHPHLTVVRFRVPPPRALLELLRGHLAPYSWRCRLDRVRLIRSHLDPGGARYQGLHEIGLRGD